MYIDFLRRELLEYSYLLDAEDDRRKIVFLKLVVYRSGIGRISGVRSSDSAVIILVRNSLKFNLFVWFQSVWIILNFLSGIYY